MKKYLLLAAALSPALSGCATIVRGGTEELHINSEPSGARYEIRDVNHPANSAISGVTPATVNLKKGAGYFRGASYSVTLDKPGYTPSTVNVDSHISGWYLGGNLVLGGLIGYLAVDPATGAMWKLEPKDVQVGLVPLASAANPAPAAMAGAPTPGAAPAVASAPSAVAAIAAGSARAAQPTVLRARPLAQAIIAQAVPAGTPLQLQARQLNGDGAWWFVEYQGATGWVSENGLVQ